MMYRSAALGFAAALILAAGARAQAPPEGPRFYNPRTGINDPVPCDRLPAAAAKRVPAPFDRYMRFFCFSATGQGLGAVAGVQWASPEGHGIGLSAIRVEGDRDNPRIAFSWYTKLAAVPLSAQEQAGLRGDFAQGILPEFLASVSILQLDATTSNGEAKRIFLVLPDGGRRWLIGLQCNGACYREDRNPLVFMGQPIR